MSTFLQCLSTHLKDNPLPARFENRVFRSMKDNYEWAFLTQLCLEYGGEMTYQERLCFAELKGSGDSTQILYSYLESKESLCLGLDGLFDLKDKDNFKSVPLFEWAKNNALSMKLTFETAQAPAHKALLLKIPLAPLPPELIIWKTQFEKAYLDQALEVSQSSKSMPRL